MQGADTCTCRRRSIPFFIPCCSGQGSAGPSGHPCASSVLTVACTVQPAGWQQVSANNLHLPNVSVRPEPPTQGSGLFLFISSLLVKLLWEHGRQSRRFHYRNPTSFVEPTGSSGSAPAQSEDFMSCPFQTSFQPHKTHCQLTCCSLTTTSLSHTVYVHTQGIQTTHTHRAYEPHTHTNSIQTTHTHRAYKPQHRAYEPHTHMTKHQREEEHRPLY